MLLAHDTGLLLDIAYYLQHGGLHARGQRLATDLHALIAREHYTGPLVESEDGRGPSAPDVAPEPPENEWPAGALDEILDESRLGDAPPAPTPPAWSAGVLGRGATVEQVGSRLQITVGEGSPAESLLDARHVLTQIASGGGTTAPVGSNAVFLATILKAVLTGMLTGGSSALVTQTASALRGDLLVNGQ